jgi:serine/threonine-protein kinase HipA
LRIRHAARRFFLSNTTESGCKLNISSTDNAQDLSLALDFADRFRLKKPEAEQILSEIVKAVRQWKEVAQKFVSAKEISRMKNAFRVAERFTL